MKIIFIDNKGNRHPIKEITFGDFAPSINSTNTTGNVLAVTCIDGIQFEGSEIKSAGYDLIIEQ